MIFALVIVFACGNGCGEPAEVTVDEFSTYEACHTAGLQWITPSADPQHAIRIFECRPGGKSLPRHKQS